ncbi:signal transduction histidine kinase [Roseateles asaccharophilus]|uniref:sensor histidine kinase n=1 Tax=Roseateles asaccharophilus TaxID=582607 RepID=UPI003832AE8C
MAQEPEINLVEQGRERQTTKLRKKVYWSLVAMALVGAAPGLLVSDGPRESVLVLLFLFASLLVAAYVTDAVMMPIEVLRRRLEVRNYGDFEDNGFGLTDAADLDIGRDSFEFTTALAALRPAKPLDLEMPLPAELVAIEKQARAGRVSELAVESVRRDLFRHLSHQLKSPLANIKSRAEKIHRHRDEEETVLQEADTISSICMTLSTLIEQMLALSYVVSFEEKGAGQQKVNLSKEILTSANHRERVASDKGIVIDAQVEAGLWVRGQSALLQEMVSSLLDNAIRYSPEKSKIQVQARKLPGAKVASIIIQDEGPGIPESERERVFEPFYGAMGLDARGNMTFGTRRDRVIGPGVDKKSHGLGLALVKAVAKLHGANLTLNDAPGGQGLSVRIVMSTCEPPELPQH